MLPTFENFVPTLLSSFCPNFVILQYPSSPIYHIVPVEHTESFARCYGELYNIEDIEEYDFDIYLPSPTVISPDRTYYCENGYTMLCNFETMKASVVSKPEKW